MAPQPGWQARGAHTRGVHVSTRGIAHHQRGTFPVIDSDAESAARKARLAGRDAAYRAALRLGADEPLPGALGNVSHATTPLTRGLPSGGRMRRQIYTI